MKLTKTTVYVCLTSHLQISKSTYKAQGPLPSTIPRPIAAQRLRSNDGRRLRHPCFNGADGPTAEAAHATKLPPAFSEASPLKFTRVGNLNKNMGDVGCNCFFLETKVKQT